MFIYLPPRSSYNFTIFKGKENKRKRSQLQVSDVRTDAWEVTQSSTKQSTFTGEDRSPVNERAAAPERECGQRASERRGEVGASERGNLTLPAFSGYWLLQHVDSFKYQGVAVSIP